jgi:hypothetical protein
MKKAETIIGILALFALAMKFLLIPGGGLLTVISLSALSRSASFAQQHPVTKCI